MARALRIEYPGAVYHVTFRGDRQKRSLTRIGQFQSFQPFTRYAPFEMLFKSIVHIKSRSYIPAGESVNSLVDDLPDDIRIHRMAAGFSD